MNWKSFFGFAGLFAILFAVEIVLGLYDPKKGWWGLLLVFPVAGAGVRIVVSEVETFSMLMATAAQTILYSYLLSVVGQWRVWSRFFLVLLHVSAMKIFWDLKS